MQPSSVASLLVLYSKRLDLSIPFAFFLFAVSKQFQNEVDKPRNLCYDIRGLPTALPSGHTVAVAFPVLRDIELGKSISLRIGVCRFGPFSIVLIEGGDV